MALIKHRPKTSSLRGKISLKRKYPKFSRVRSLVVSQKGPVARSHGTVSMRHRSRGVKKLYRVIDFRRDKHDIPGKVVSIQYDPNRGSSIALIVYKDGEKRFILRPRGLEIGDFVISSATAVEERVGNCSTLGNLPLGVPVHNVELHPKKGGEIARGAGNFCIIMAKESGYASVKMPSGEVKKIRLSCFATIGSLDNEDVKNISFGKAGIKKHIGRRSKVRGVAYGNPRKHPHGGSYKTSGVGRKSPVSPWGQPAKGFKTRKRLHTDKYIVEKRKN
jgi:large subunit ribosomal protein L2